MSQQEWYIFKQILTSEDIDDIICCFIILVSTKIHLLKIKFRSLCFLIISSYYRHKCYTGENTTQSSYKTVWNPDGILIPAFLAINVCKNSQFAKYIIIIITLCLEDMNFIFSMFYE